VQTSALNAVKTSREEFNGNGNGADHEYKPSLDTLIDNVKACSITDPDCEACQ
jgi:hypothetical protein